MITDAVLTRTSDRIIKYIEKYVTLVSAERKEEVLELFDNIHRLFPHWVIATCPMIHRDLQYVSKNGPSVFGYSKEYLIKNSLMEKYFAFVHEADQKDLYDCMS